MSLRSMGVMRSCAAPRPPHGDLITCVLIWLTRVACDSGRSDFPPFQKGLATFNRFLPCCSKWVKKDRSFGRKLWRRCITTWSVVQSFNRSTRGVVKLDRKSEACFWSGGADRAVGAGGRDRLCARRWSRIWSSHRRRSDDRLALSGAPAGPAPTSPPAAWDELADMLAPMPWRSPSWRPDAGLGDPRFSSPNCGTWRTTRIGRRSTALTAAPYVDALERHIHQRCYRRCRFRLPDGRTAQPAWRYRWPRWRRRAKARGLIVWRAGGVVVRVVMSTAGRSGCPVRCAVTEVRRRMSPAI